MQFLNSEDIRDLWKKFWEDQNQAHKEVKANSLIPDSKDKTVLFTTAGMQQLVPYLMWKPHPLWKRVYNIQKCLRTWDIDEVWDERHLTFFEMMWNWSLWDYFKKEAINWSYEFLTKYLWIEHEKIWATVFAGEWNIPTDEESINIWKSKGIDSNKIRKLSADDNFRGPAGEVGPCWPCSEMYFDRGDDYGPADWKIWENNRYIEIWNDVFMEFYKDEKGQFEKLTQQNVDTWMWLERICMVMQSKETIFETDLFEPIIKTIEKYLNIKYPAYDKQERNFDENEKIITKKIRIITDHLRSAIFLIWDGAIPSNEWRGYVLRRIIRRAYFNIISIKKDFNQLDSFLDEILNNICQKYWNYRKDIVINKDNIKITLKKEIQNFENTLEKWLKIFEDYLKEFKSNILPWDMVFKLYDTYGFPLELTNEIALLKWYKVDMLWFEIEMSKAKQKSRASSKEMFKRWIDWSKHLEWIPQTQFIGYELLNSENIKILKEIEIEGQKIIIFDKTPFYAESGWQTWDRWKVILDDNTELKIKDVQKYAWVFLHFIE